MNKSRIFNISFDNRAIQYLLKRQRFKTTYNCHFDRNVIISIFNFIENFIWDSSRLEFEAARHCELITAGDLFGRSGYGIGLQKNSPWEDKVTLAILDFHESKKNTL